MSVINDVLIELEKRRASPEERRGISNHVRALPVVKEPARVRIIALTILAAIVVLSAGGYFYYSALTAPADPRPMGASTSPVIPQAQPSPAEVPSESVMIGRLTLELSRDPGVMPEQPPPQNPRATRETAVNGAIPTARVLSSKDVRDDRVSETPVRPKEEASPLSVAPAAVAPVPRASQARPPETAKVSDVVSADIDKQVRRPTAAQQAETEYGRALQSLQQGRSADAREHLDVALRLNAEHVAARQTLLGLLVQSKQLPEAERLMQEGLRILPGQTRFTVALARLQVDRGDVASALETLQSGASYAQGNAEYAAFFGGLLQRRQRHAEAVQQFQQALQARPQTGLWWLGLAMSLQALGQKAEAQDAYRRALGSNNLSADMQAFADQQLRQLN